jgi:hypothetical protein
MTKPNWLVVYEDDIQVGSYSEIDRERMKGFSIWPPGVPSKVFSIPTEFSDNDNFFYRRRTRLNPGEEAPAVVHLFGWFPDRFYALFGEELFVINNFDGVGGPPEPLPHETWTL